MNKCFEFDLAISITCNLDVLQLYSMASDFFSFVLDTLPPTFSKGTTSFKLPKNI